LSALSQFSTPTFFVRFSSTRAVCRLDLCFQSPFCFGRRFSILRCLFSFHRVFVHSSVQDRPELCSPFRSPSIWGSSVLPCRKLVLDLTAGSVPIRTQLPVPLPLLVISSASACVWFLPSSRWRSLSSVVVRLTGLKPSVSGCLFSARV
jgi:hypothetical protein